MALAFDRVPTHLKRAIKACFIPSFRGRVVASWPMSFCHSGIAVSPNDEVFICDKSKNCVRVFSTDGTFLRTWGTRGRAAGEFEHPVGIAVAPRDTGPRAGEVVVTDLHNHRVQVFRLDGTFLRMWGSEGSGDGQFCFPRGVAVAPGVGPGGEGEVVVADHNNHRIQVFRLSDGAFVRKWGRNGPATGQLRYPTSVCMISAREVGQVMCLYQRVGAGGCHRLQSLSHASVFP